MNNPQPFPFFFVDTDDSEQHAAWSNTDPRTICNKSCRPLTISAFPLKGDHCRICNMVWHERARNYEALERHKTEIVHLSSRLEEILSRLSEELIKNQLLSAELDLLRGSAPDGTQK